MLAEHGTYDRYTKGCDCILCDAAARKVWRARQERGAMAGGSVSRGGRSGPNHGLRSTYNHGCRCDLCRRATADYMQVRRIAKRLAEGRPIKPYRPERILAMPHKNCKCARCKRMEARNRAIQKSLR